MFWKKDKPKAPVNYVGMLARLQAGMELPPQGQYYFPELPPQVAPKEHMLAQDSMCQAMAGYAGLQPQFQSDFVGYAELSRLALSSEYRAVAETTAEEMTREWGKIKGGNDHKKIEALEEAMEKFNIRNLFRKHIENDNLYGGSQLFIRIKGHESKQDKPLILDERGIKQDSLEGFSVIEPIWTTPSVYNATDPTADDFFKPTVWYIMGKQTHSDRLLTLIMRPVPDMLKPAYNFRGVSMTQLMIPYVQRFHSTVDAIADIIPKFVINGLKTDMGSILSGGESNQMIARAKIFTHFQKNDNLMLLDNSNQEEFFQFSTPLSTLDALQDQSHKMLCTPSKTPQVKLTGLAEGGLNASQDGEIRVYYDHIAALQNAHLLPQMQVILRVLQLHLFGKVDENIFFQFNSLYQLDDEQRATVNLTKAQTYQVLLQEGVLDQEAVLGVLSNDEDGEFTGMKDTVQTRDPYSDVDSDE